MEQIDEQLKRFKSSELDKILGKKFPVLNDGFIRVVDYMGNDATIVQAARVSYSKGTKKVSEDRDLVAYLYRNGHLTPFEMCELKLHVRVPMDCWRQWIRHRMSSTNERSSRYSVIDDGAQKTGVLDWRKQSKDNKQGSSGLFLSEGVGENLSFYENQIQKACLDTYKHRLELDVAKEQARKDLPLSTYTEAYWKIDLRNLFNFLRQRMDSHAQKEIRSYANIIGERIVAKWVPHAWEAFSTYELGSVRLSEKEIKIIELANKNISKFTFDENIQYEIFEIAEEYGWLCAKVNEEDAGKLDYYLSKNKSKKMEREECEYKFHTIGTEVPWHYLKEEE